MPFSYIIIAVMTCKLVNSVLVISQLMYRKLAKIKKKKKKAGSFEEESQCHFRTSSSSKRTKARPLLYAEMQKGQNKRAIIESHSLPKLFTRFWRRRHLCGRYLPLAARSSVEKKRSHGKQLFSVRKERVVLGQGRSGTCTNYHDSTEDYALRGALPKLVPRGGHDGRFQR